MQKLSINIKGLTAKNYDRVSTSFDLDILLNVDDKEEVITKKFMGNSKTEVIFNELISAIKEEYKKRDKGNIDDPFDRMVVIIENLEDVEEKVLNFFRRFNEKLRSFKLYKSYSDYMNVYHTMKDGFSMTFS